MALETIMSPPNNVSSYQQQSNESSSTASPSVHARYEKPEIAKYGSSRVRVRNTTKTSISPMPHVTQTGQPPQVLQPLLLSEHGQRSAEALEQRKNKNKDNYKNCRHSLFATPFRRRRSHIVEHQQKNDGGAKGQQQVGTPRSTVPPSPTTPRSNRQGTIMETPTTGTCLQQLPTPSTENNKQQIQQQQPQQQHERITEKESEPTSNEIESLETCSSVSLDIVDQDFPWNECIGYATSSNPTASVFFIQIPPSLTTVTDDMSSVDSDSDSDTDSSSDSDSVYSFEDDDDDESDEDVDQSKNQCISQVLVVKSSHTIVQELFGLFLAEWFHIRTPQVALIEKFPHARFTLDETEQNGVSRDKDTLSIEQRVGYHWKQLIHSLKRMAQQDENYGLEIKVDKDLGSSMFLLLMEFMSSAQSLDELDSGGAVAVDDQTMEEDDGDVNDTSTGRDDSEKPTVLLRDSVPFCTQLLRGLGRLVIVDILLNNWDRIPAIWDNYGNAGNVLIGVEQFDDDGGDTEREDGESSVKVVVYGIDQALGCIVEESDQQLYLDKVQQFVRDYRGIKGAAQGEQGERGEAFVSKIDSSVYLQSILDFVKNPFRSMADVKGVERRLAISDHEAKVAIWKGMRDSVRHARKLSLRQLRKLKRRVNRMKTGRSNETANEYWNGAMDSLLDINFVHRIAQQFQQKPMNQ